MAEDATVGDLADSLNRQTANLDRANGQNAAVIDIIRACDEAKQP